MMDNVVDPEELINCPYNNAHVFKRGGAAIHLHSCRADHVELSRKLVTCPFNNGHVVPRPEIDLHKSWCPSRDTYYSHVCSTTEISDAVQKLVQNADEKLSVVKSSVAESGWDEEVWDEEPGDASNTNILNKVKQQKSGLLRLHQNMKPAERKAKRQEDWQKNQARQ